MRVDDKAARGEDYGTRRPDGPTYCTCTKVSRGQQVSEPRISLKIRNPRLVWPWQIAKRK